eukprot:3416558-Rhodomonas_salina.2
MLVMRLVEELELRAIGFAAWKPEVGGQGKSATPTAAKHPSCSPVSCACSLGDRGGRKRLFSGAAK